MRHRTILVLACLPLVTGASNPGPAAVGSGHAPSTHPAVAVGPDIYGVDLSVDQVLPVRGVELPLATDVAGGPRLVPEATAVQAIPTPTGFHAGIAALTALAVWQGLGRRRRSRRPVG